MTWYKPGFLSFFLTAAVFLTTPSVAPAGIVSFTLIGDVTFADEENVFGLTEGDTITAMGEYDDSFYNGVGEKEVPFGIGTGNSLKIQLGEVLLEEFNDIDFLDGFYPSITFFNGEVADTNIQMTAGKNDSPVDFSSFDSFVAGFFDTGDGEGDGTSNADFSIVAGEWRVVSIPEPSSIGALTLITAGVVFGAFRRRRRLR